ncbi:hypothetical protein SAMN04489761_4092 [Tenacibaculum sp. MAR_2009_124]|uniref:hypothetical protein n=1 Tax=Tenacibaculum sp. MAR_2009_124 TaxID=1250059 RepID=UPI00089D93FA|nr:hypothetical protein [Tenacibaculum sp. MAR_2009_124]SED04705.1 hypothetical protein SAMN04489761_4092 [Tenacibaculum sp. MAR_2009_124]
MKISKTSRASKALSVYMALSLIFPQTFINSAFALTGGPSQPEFNAFTPIGTTDMVDLSSGDFNYNIPIMDVGGYPLNLAYTSGVNMDQEASWVGLGWNLNVGHIKRSVRGLPDDFDGSQENGDQMRYENYFKPNKTFGAHFGLGASFFGLKELGTKGSGGSGNSGGSGGSGNNSNSSGGGSGLLNVNIGLGVEYNNYSGYSATPSLGVSIKLAKNASVGMDISASAVDGPTISPVVSLSKKIEGKKYSYDGGGSIGLSINSRKAISTLNLSAGLEATKLSNNKSRSIGHSGSIPLNDHMVFTPNKRVATISTQSKYSAAIGGTVFGISGQVKVTGYGSEQSVHPKHVDRPVAAFGYEYTEKNEKDTINGILDFVREKDRNFNKHTTILPVTNYTYDNYVINGQGVGGAFRPHRGQIGFLNDTRVVDSGDGSTFGAEAEGGWVFALGVDYHNTDTYSRSENWAVEAGNYALNKFTDKTDSQGKAYEKVFFKDNGDMNVDYEQLSGGMYSDTSTGGTNPVRLGISGNKHNRTLIRNYHKNDNSLLRINETKIRENRLLRNQVIQKITQQEAQQYYNGFFRTSIYGKPHHTAGFNVLKPDGSRYVYGLPAYNITKKEVTFAVSQGATVDDNKGLVTYIPDPFPNDETPQNDNSTSNGKGVDNYFNRITTPAHAHSYLISSVLSSDYEDVTGNGPTDDDFGAYTKFSYERPYKYNWRVPYTQNTATFNRGLYSHPNDQKGNYIYGEREQVYINEIETKTHIAIFSLSDRKDGYGVIDENGGRGIATTKRIDSISLYSKKEYQELGTNAIPIKVAHFEYDYSLCRGIPNNSRISTPGELNQGGKLTLKKLYFTYRDSHMGRHMPYEFDYGQIDTDGNGVFDKTINPSYHIKGYDIWGNFKENKGNGDNLDGVPSNAEFPYTEQIAQTNDPNQNTVHDNSVAWSLTTVQLPSGGDLKLDYEADDYQFVQDKKVMQLFQVTGAGSSQNPTSSEITNNTLYNNNQENKYIYVKIPEAFKNKEVADFIGGLEEEPIYFKFLLNMTKTYVYQYDYVSGYLHLDDSRSVLKFTDNTDEYLSIPMRFLRLDGKEGDPPINPISKAGMYFGRHNMNRIVYHDHGQYSSGTGFTAIVKEIVASIGAYTEIGKGPNKVLREKSCAKFFKPNKSWIRLHNPIAKKYGGGLRIKKLQMSDNWDVMTGNDGDPLYKKFYGHEYVYKNEDNTSSGVATFEPNSSRENPFVIPVYNRETGGSEAVIAPMESNYVEKPIGESFFPAPTVTYGRVMVKNLTHESISKHATGKVEHQFYTSKDFPTKTSHTDLVPKESLHNDPPGAVSSFLSFSVKHHLTASQGFVVEANNMNGKPLGNWVYTETGTSPISGVKYEYDLEADGSLNNIQRIINNQGNISEVSLGVTYDVVNDFRSNYNRQVTVGVNTNLAGFLAFIWPVLVPVPLPNYESNENVFRSAVTTKVIKRKGILKKKIAYDLGAQVSTENLAWDAESGQVLVTKTKNEYGDHYYNMNYPAYWKHYGMASASRNLGISGELVRDNTGNTFSLSRNDSDLSSLLDIGDELNATVINNISLGGAIIPLPTSEKLWIIRKKETSDLTKFILMNQEGEILNDCRGESGIASTARVFFKVGRSSHRNLQSASMASITTKQNPIVDQNNNYRSQLPSFLNNNPQETKIINASAVQYSDFWKPVNQNNNKYFVIDSSIYTNEQLGELNEDKLLEIYDNYDINPYVHNIRGNWKAKKSWAYLTGRYNSYEPNTRDDGYFTSFTPFYSYNNGWEINSNAINQHSSIKWTFASEVTQYAPQGVELENKDALNRYSSAQYGYKYTLPTAVASNTAYKELGYDGFEDYPSLQLSLAERRSVNHFSFVDAFSLESSSMVTDQEAHTGRKSIEVKPSKSVSLIKKLDDVNPNIVEDCVDEPNGDITITDGGTPVDIICHDDPFFSYRRVFTVVGNPNETVNYKIYGNVSIGDSEHEGVMMTEVRTNGSTTSQTRTLLDTNVLEENAWTRSVKLNTEGKSVITVAFCPILCENSGNVLQPPSIIRLKFKFSESAIKDVSADVRCAK